MGEALFLFLFAILQRQKGSGRIRLMSHDHIICEKCGHQIELSAAFAKDIQKREQEKHMLEIEKLKKEIEITRSKELQKIELQFEEKENSWKKKEEAWKRAKELALEDAKNEAATEAKKSVEGLLGKLQAELEINRKDLQKAKGYELELRKKQSEFENLEKDMELKFHREMDLEKKRLQNEVVQKAEEKYRLKQAENDMTMESMRQQIRELERKTMQGSQQLQGEVLELDLEQKLKAEFIYDEISPVGKGIRGGDIIQTITTRSGKICGKILWETKRTKSWSDAWVSKLKDDQRECGANLAVLVSEVLPQGWHHFRKKDEVWVTDIPSAISLAIALRVVLIQVARTQEIQTGKEEKMERVYNYLLGNQFKNRVQAIVEAFTSLKTDLDSEKRAMTRIWAKREKQIDRVIMNTAGLYGDLEGEGLSNHALPEIKNLQLEEDTVESFSEE